MRLLVLCAILVSGCDSTLDQPEATAPQPASPTSGTPSASVPDMAGDMGYVPPTCGMQSFAIGLNQPAPAVLLVVDKSGSMREKIAGTTQTKWDAAKGAVEALLGSYMGKVRWGLSIFPRDSECAAGQVDIPVGDNTAMSIINLLKPVTAEMIGGSTPTATTLDNLRTKGGLGDPARNNYLLLLTDGLPTCGQDGRVTPIVKALYAQSPSVRTFVVGLGDATASDPKQLDEWADAGSTARTGAAQKYYQANNLADLQAAFAEIISGVASCTYKLDQPPPDPKLLVGTVDGAQVGIDPANGLTYDAGSQSITFHGTSCAKIKGGAKKVDLVYGCPLPEVG